MFLRRRVVGSAVAALCVPQTVAPQTAVVAPPVTSVSSPSTGSTASLQAVVAAPSLMGSQCRFYCTPQHCTALDIAMKVNKLKRMHQTGQGDNKKRIEQTAWKELNTLSENQISEADGKAVALLLSSWAYFAKYWEKGKDGPLIRDDQGAKAQSDAES